MIKPFQFSIGRMLCAMALFCLTAWSFSALLGHVDGNRRLAPFIWHFLSCLSLGAGVAALGAPVIDGAVAATFWFLVSLLALVVVRAVR